MPLAAPSMFKTRNPKVQLQGPRKSKVEWMSWRNLLSFLSESVVFQVVGLTGLSIRMALQAYIYFSQCSFSAQVETGNARTAAAPSSPRPRRDPGPSMGHHHAARRRCLATPSWRNASEWPTTEQTPWDSWANSCYSNKLPWHSSSCFQSTFVLDMFAGLCFIRYDFAHCYRMFVCLFVWP